MVQFIVTRGGRMYAVETVLYRFFSTKVKIILLTLLTYAALC